jgi:hypothetical protein
VRRRAVRRELDGNAWIGDLTGIGSLTNLTYLCVPFTDLSPCVAPAESRDRSVERRMMHSEKLRIVTLGFGTGRQELALERDTNPKHSRRTYTCEYALQSR